MRYTKNIVTGVLITILSCIVVVVTGNIAMARVTGNCHNCHTMHNSQDGTSTDEGGGPSPFLVRTTNAANICVGCHTGDSSEEAPPQIDKIYTAPSAGGSFKSDTGNAGAPTDSYVHNVNGLDSEDTQMFTPPGWVQPGSGAHSTTSWDAGNRLTCAGTNGCHGKTDGDNIDIHTAIKGAHHTDDSTLHDDTLNTGGGTVGASYRFLYGVQGKEDSSLDSGKYDWTENSYWAGSSGKTISELCAECHGDFHTTDNTNANSPFKRHPTDHVIDTNNNTGLDSAENIVTAGAVPVGWESGSSQKSVICQSCHTSHGGYKDILRFDYDALSAGDGSGTTGCDACHARQR